MKLDKDIYSPKEVKVKRQWYVSPVVSKEIAKIKKKSGKSESYIVNHFLMCALEDKEIV